MTIRGFTASHTARRPADLLRAVLGALGAHGNTAPAPAGSGQPAQALRDPGGGGYVRTMTSAIELHGPPHAERYLETNGEDGFHWRQGTAILILFTTGRKSGERRSHALIFREYEGAYLVVASKGGADAPPAWFVNLRADWPDYDGYQKKTSREIPVVVLERAA